VATRRSSGAVFFVLLLLAGAGYVVASRLGYVDKYVDRFQTRFLGRTPVASRLSPGDFPAGVAAPVGDLASVPLRPTLVGFTPRGSSAALLLATGGAGPEHGEGLFKSGYALDAQAIVFAREEDLRRALASGAEAGGVDLAAISVDGLAQSALALRDAAPRTVMLLGRSRGQEALAAVGVASIAELKGKRIAAYGQSSSYFFALWLLSRAGLTTGDVTWVELSSALEAGPALREGRADAVAGLFGDVELAARDRGGKVLATSADAPHLIATVLVARGDFAARYPDAVRRVLRGLLDAGAIVQKDPGPAARLLGEVAPYLGDPGEAIKSAPPATLKDNLAFFGLSGEAPVTYDELFQSAGALSVKVGKSTSAARAEDTRDLGALKYVSEARGP
jgi:ABC-type nitrate/sulfonate/bicarbonate transport system substrate-binding protein